ncbi:GntR family transcriptional regulator [Rubrivivax sp. A210]|uniref:GntR family transcriptional regulator n=1 Tax=Rubrivivax sp. A210 TaxID=2772301 RepID=UPI00191B30EC|nr:GntR family transcriptional regulator [Rubrivivax sp. A210]
MSRVNAKGDPTIPIDLQKLITSIRINLKRLATASAATLRDEAALQRIEALHERFSREISQKRPDGARLIATNKELHFAIYSQAGMPMLLQMIESLWLRVGPTLNYDLRVGSTRISERVSADHHRQIVAALKRKDGSAAADALRDDIQSAADFIVSSWALLGAELPAAAPLEPVKAPRRGRASSSARAGAGRLAVAG